MASPLSIRPSPHSEFGSRFPGLVTLASECLNLEWDFEYGSPEDAVMDFAAQFPDEVASCVAGIEALLAECPDEDSRGRELGAMGWGFGGNPGRLDALLIWARDTLRQPSSTEIAAG
jgi:hypothetical protein